MRMLKMSLPLLLCFACGEGGLDPENREEVLGADEGRRDPVPGGEVPPAPETVSTDVEGAVERPDSVDSTGFFVAGGRLYDAFGNDFVIRGVNNAHAWFDPGKEQALGALDNISALGFNAVRIVWEADSPSNSPTLLRQILAKTVEERMIPMIELHDVTGGRLNDELLRMAEYLTREDIAQILKDYEQYLLVNIANEWSGDDFYGGYSAAVDHLRSEGINHTLVIDANGWGQNVEAVFADGPRLLEEDPQHNLLFSTHMYERYSVNARILDTFERAVEEQIPLIVGEFGWQHGRPAQAIDVAYIFEQASKQGIGLIPWSWKGNSADVAYLDMSQDWEGMTLTDWGHQVLSDEYGVTATSLRASVFLLAE